MLPKRMKHHRPVRRWIRETLLADKEEHRGTPLRRRRHIRRVHAKISRTGKVVIVHVVEIAFERIDDAVRLVNSSSVVLTCARNRALVLAQCKLHVASAAAAAPLQVA